MQTYWLGNAYIHEKQYYIQGSGDLTFFSRDSFSGLLSVKTDFLTDHVDLI
ncbi:MAG: hypothetical protein ACTSVU_01100 [Promethearchaeota archaeon]